MKVSVVRLAFGCLKSRFQKAPCSTANETAMVLSKYELVMLNDGLTAILQDMYRDLDGLAPIVADNVRRRRDDMRLLQKRLRDELTKEEQ